MWRLNQLVDELHHETQPLRPFPLAFRPFPRQTAQSTRASGSQVPHLTTPAQNADRCPRCTSFHTCVGCERGEPTPSGAPHACRVCGASFSSRNQLFAHLQQTGHQRELRPRRLRVPAGIVQPLISSRRSCSSCTCSRKSSSWRSTVLQAANGWPRLCGRAPTVVIEVERVGREPREAAAGAAAAFVMAHDRGGVSMLPE